LLLCLLPLGLHAQGSLTPPGAPGPLITRAALSTGGRAKGKFLPVISLFRIDAPTLVEIKKAALVLRKRGRKRPAAEAARPTRGLGRPARSADILVDILVCRIADILVG
jgi:hypothetical protein